MSSLIETSLIETGLNNGTNVQLTASGNITVQSSIDKIAGTDAALSIDAGENLFVYADIKSQSGKLHLDFDANSYTQFRGDIATNGGDVNIQTTGTNSNAGEYAYILDSSINTAGGDFSVRSASDAFFGTIDNSGTEFAANIQTGNGDTQVIANEFITFTAGTINTNNASLTSRTVTGGRGGFQSPDVVASGDVTVNGVGLGFSVAGQSDNKLTLRYSGGRVNGNHHGLMRENGFGTIELAMGTVSDAGPLNAARVDARIESGNGDFIGAIIQQNGFHFKETGFTRLEERTGVVNTKGIKTS